MRGGDEDRPHSSLGYRTPEEFARQAASPSWEGNSAAADRRQGNPVGPLRSALTPVAPCAKTFHQEGEAKEKAVHLPHTSFVCDRKWERFTEL